MKKTTRNIIIIVAAVVAAIGIVLAIVLPITLRHSDELYTVTFNSNGGTDVESITNVKRNSTITEPEAPTRDGYAFKGWFRDTKLTKEWKFDTDTVTGNITLYAKWEYNATSGLSMLPNGESYTITGLGSATDVTDVVIPSIFNNLPVTTIAVDAFANVSTITSVYVPASVTAVKDRAFINCSNLQWVTIAGKAELGERLFAECSKLERVTLPDNLTEIKHMTFESCVNLVDVNIPSSVKTIGNRAFYECKKLPSFDFPSELTTIGEQAFSSCESLTEVKLPATIKNLGQRKEDGQIVKREQNVFTGCVNLETLTVESSNTASYYSQGNCIISIGTDESGNTVRTLVAGCKTSVIPNNVTVIGESAFQGCRELTNANVITSGVTTINDSAFYGCNGLERIVIPASVTSIGNYAFTECSRLEVVIFGTQSGSSGLQTIGREAFSCCNFSGFNIPKSVTFIGAGAFYDNPISTLTYLGAEADFGKVVIGSVPTGEVNYYNGIINISFSDNTGGRTISGLTGNPNN